MAIAAIAFGLAIGLALGTLGGGGSVLAVPVLVYGFGLGAHEATTTSLLVVSAASLAAGLVQARGQRVCWPQAMAFAPGAVAGAVGGSLANREVGSDVLLAGFAAVMLAAAVFTWRKAATAAPSAPGTCPPLQTTRTLGAGLLVGVLTGFFGVGGGFLVVPLLALGLRFPLRQAIGTSLVIVAFVSLVGLAAHLAAGGSADAGAGVPMAAACVAGALAGARLTGSVPQRALGRGFALLVGVVAVVVVVLR